MAGAAALFAPAFADAGLDRAVRGLQTWLDGTRTLEGRFRQSLLSAALGAGVEERGRILIAKPGHLRWDYLDPERKTAIVDGDRTLLYLPEDRQLIRGRISREHAILPDLLAGGGRVSDLFEVSSAGTEGAGAGVKLRLRPRAGDGTIEEATLGLDARTFAIVEAEVLDAAGNRMLFRFEGWKRNGRIPEGTFAFEPPAGTEIVDSE